MTVLSLLNPFGWFSSGPAKLSGGNQPTGWGSSSSYAGKPVTPERALELAAYWACVKIIAQTIGTLSCRLYNQAENGSRTPAVTNPLYDLLLHQPNADHSAVEFWEGVGACLAIWGNAFALKGKVGGRLVALDLLRPYGMTVLRNEDGEPVYRYSDPVRGGKVEEYGPDDLLVVRGFGFCDLTGLSPVAFARQTIGSAIAADEAAGSLFRNGLRMSGWFKYTGGNGVLNKQQQEDTKAALIAPYTGSENTGKVGLLPGDFSWLATAMNPEDAQLLETRRMGVEEICRFFGVPPILVGHSASGQTMWGTGVDSIVLGFMTTGLRPYLKRIEAAISRDVIGRSERQTLVVAFDVTELLRGDNKGQAEIDRSLANTGIKTRNEIRAERNMPPMEGGDTLTVQSALLPIEMLGQVARLPADKPVGEGADIVAAEKLLARGIELGFKYSDGQPRDPHGRWSSGDGGSVADAPSRPLLSNRTLMKAGVFLGSAAAVGAAVALNKGKPYKIATNTPLHDTHRAFHSASLTAPLSETEKKSIHDYTAHDFAGINQRLRLRNKPNANIENIDSALRKASLSEDTVVYRGLNMDRSKKILSTPPGQMFLDRGYPSTTVHEHVGRRFSQTVNGAPAASSKRGYVVSINVDRGANALPLHPEHVRFGDEHEVLLPRGSAFKMLRVDHDTRTIYAHHVGTVHEMKSTDKPFDDVAGSLDKGAWSDDELEWFELPVGDTTAVDYADYTPPQPVKGRKAFDPSQPRDNQGQWTDGGGSSGSGASGGSGDTDPFGQPGYKPGKDWEVAKDAAFSIATGVAITAAVGIAVALAPEVFAVGGSAAAIGAGVEAGNFAKLTTMVDGLAEGAFWNAGMQSGKVILNHLGLNTAKAEDTLKGVIGLAPGKAASSSVERQLRAGLVAVADKTKAEMLAHLDRHKQIPAERLKAVRVAIDDACSRFKAKLA